MPMLWIMLRKQELIPIRLEQGRAIPFCTTPGVTQTRSTPHSNCICTNTRAHTRITNNILSSHGIVMQLGSQTEFCLLHISCVFDINAMLMKPLTPSFTCLFHFAGNFKQPWGATNTVAHNKNIVKIKSIVVPMSKASMKM